MNQPVDVPASHLDGAGAGGNNVDKAGTDPWSAKMRGKHRRTLLPWLLAGAGMTLATAAAADAIDGDWCRSDGKRMSIHGPDIVTPGGKQTRGDYTRHSFKYLVPAGEAGAGDFIEIILRSEFLAYARQGSGTDLQEWKRCSATVS